MFQGQRSDPLEPIFKGAASNAMTQYKKVEIPRTDGFDARRLQEYHQLLMQFVFPFVDDLVQDGLADGYDFLSHSGVDLRLWLSDDADLAEVRKRLRQRGLPETLVDYAPEETGEDRVRLLSILRRGAEQVRDLLEDHSDLWRPEEVVHWFLNQYGLHNTHEAQFHESQASAWKRQLEANSDP